MAKALLIGSTGLVGSYILSTLRTSSQSSFTSVEILARRPAPETTNATVAVSEFIEKDTTNWAGHITSLSPTPSVMFSSLATTRGQAGSFENQYKIEHDLNIELAKAAKEAGITTYVLISANGSNPKSMVGYVKMKGEIEEHVKELGFAHTIIVRPGLIIGKREDSRGFESVLQKVASAMGHVHSSLKDVWAQDAAVIAKAAVSAAIKAQNGEVKEKLWVLEQSDIVRLGLKEWKD
jgi:uncharacterized protein YbjT (DUF2867 family)